MPGTNQFLAFANASGANVISQSAYASLAALSTGFQSGIAQSAQCNKVWRQGTLWGAVLGQLIVDQLGQNAVDDATPTGISTLEQQLILAIQAMTRQKVTAATLNFYVSPSGNDANAGTNPSAPKQTIMAALNAAYNQFDYNGNTLTINIGAGTYTQPVNIVELPLGCTRVNLIGNNSSPSSVAINVPSANAISLSINTNVSIQGLTVQASGTGAVGYGIVVNQSTAVIQNIIFGSCGNVQLSGGSLAYIQATGPLVFQGSSTWGVAAESASQLFLNDIAITFVGGTAYSQAWALATQAGFLNAARVSFSGSFSGQRFNGDMCGGFGTFSADQNTYFPGTLPGILSRNAVWG